MRRRAFGLHPVPSLPSRPFGFNPSRLRVCGAARFACLQGKAQRAIPAAQCLAPLDTAEPATPDRLGQRLAAMDGAGEHAGACCDRLCECVQSSTLAVLAHHVTKDGSRTSVRHCHGASTTRLKTSAAKCGRGVLAGRRVVDLVRVSGRAGAAFVRGCRVGPIFFRCGSAQGVLALS